MAVKTLKLKLNKKQKENLIKQFMPLVFSLAKKYHRGAESLEDLQQIGFLGLLKAAQRFNKKYKVQFSTYALPTIEGEIRHHLRDKISSIKISRKLIELNAKANKFIAAYQQKQGSVPNQKQIASQLKVAEPRLIKAMNAVEQHFTISLDTPFLMFKGGSAKTTTSLENIVGQESFVEKLIDKEGLKFALKTLTEREREIIHAHFFNDIRQEVLAKKFKVTQAQISRIIALALKKMQVVLSI